MILNNFGEINLVYISLVAALLTGNRVGQVGTTLSSVCSEVAQHPFFFQTFFSVGGEMGPIQMDVDPISKNR